MKIVLVLHNSGCFMLDVSFQVIFFISNHLFSLTYNEHIEFVKKIMFQEIIIISHSVIWQSKTLRCTPEQLLVQM